MIKFITKQTILLASLLLVSQFAMAQWTALGITNKSYEVIYDIESHNGALYASSSQDGLIKSTDNGTTWTPVNPTGFNSNRRVTLILDGGADLYVVTYYAVNQSSMVYKSSDAGVTFTADTVGIPKRESNNECLNIDRAYIDDGNLIIDVSNVGNYIKEPGKDWVKTTDTKALYAELFGFYDGTTYAWNEYSLAVTDDYGKTWTTPAMTGIPSLFNVSVLNVNTETGRIYAAGKAIISQDYRLMYSDDEGENWDSIPMAQYIGKNWIGQQQSIKAMYSNGDYIQIGLDNDANSSAPDVFLSEDGGITFTTDVTGLPADASQTMHANTFAFYNGYLFLAMNFQDIYRKGLSVGIHEKSLASKGITIYPNPATNILYIDYTKGLNTTIELYTTTGQKVEGIELNADNSINVANLDKGMYILKVKEGTAYIGSQIFIKQ